MPLVKAMGAPDAGNPHVRCDEGGGGASTPPPYSTGEKKVLVGRVRFAGEAIERARFGAVEAFDAIPFLEILLK